MRRTEEPEDPRRRLLVRALALGLLAASVPGEARPQGLLGSRPGRLPPGRSIYRIEGEAFVNDRAAGLATPIAPGDTVRTGPGGEIAFVVGGHAMLARGATTVVIERGGRDESIALRGLRLLSGALLSVSRDSRFRLRTTMATIGIRGTGFYAEAEPDRTYFCTCYGTTDVEADADPASRETIEASYHDRPVYILRDAPAGRAIRAAPFINHTDEELALVEALVGREPPFLFSRDSYGGPRRRY